MRVTGLRPAVTMCRVNLPRSAAAATALLLLAACTPNAQNDPPGAAPASTAPSPSKSTRAAPTDPAGQRACDAARKAGVDVSLDPAAALAIEVDAKQSTDLSIRISGALLGDAARIAVAAQGARDETTRKIELGTAAIKLVTACTTAGYYRAP